MVVERQPLNYRKENRKPWPPHLTAAQRMSRRYRSVQDTAESVKELGTDGEERPAPGKCGSQRPAPAGGGHSRLRAPHPSAEPRRMGNMLQHLQGLWRPCASAFGHHGHELDPLRRARLSGVQVELFVLSIISGCSPSVPSAFASSHTFQRGGYGDRVLHCTSGTKCQTRHRVCEGALEVHKWRQPVPYACGQQARHSRRRARQWMLPREEWLGQSLWRAPAAHPILPGLTSGTRSSECWQPRCPRWWRQQGRAGHWKQWGRQARQCQLWPLARRSWRQAPGPHLRWKPTMSRRQPLHGRRWSEGPGPRELAPKPPASTGAVSWSPVKSLKLRFTMPSNMSNAIVWAAVGLQRMLWSIRANPALARRRRRATWGSSSSPRASKRSPALAALSAVWFRTKPLSPTAAPKNSKWRRALQVPASSRSSASGKWQCRAAMSAEPTAISSHLLKFKQRPRAAAFVSTVRKARPTASMSPPRKPSSR